MSKTIHRERFQTNFFSALAVALFILPGSTTNGNSSQHKEASLSSRVYSMNITREETVNETSIISLSGSGMMSSVMGVKNCIHKGKNNNS